MSADESIHKQKPDLKCRIDPRHQESCIGGCDYLCQRLARWRLGPPPQKPESQK